MIHLDQGADLFLPEVGLVRVVAGEVQDAAVGGFEVEAGAVVRRQPGDARLIMMMMMMTTTTTTMMIAQGRACVRAWRVGGVPHSYVGVSEWC